MSRDEFCEKVRLYQDAMYAVAFSILRNDDDAADAISESVMKAYSNLSQLKTPNFRAWLLKIVHNTCLEMLRKNPNALDLDEQYNLADTAGHEDISTRLVLRQAVESLHQPYRTVVYLFYYENLSVLEISKITGSSAIAVKKQLSRARVMLQNSLNKEDFF